MKYKLISMDFDGTLLTSDKKVSNKTKNMLLKCKNEGYIIVGVTARNLSSISSVCDINMFDYLIINNGSYIYNVKAKKGISRSCIDRKIAIEITNKFKDIAQEIDYCTLNNYYIYKGSEKNVLSYRIQVKDISDVKETISRMNVFLKNNKEIEEGKKFIKENFNTINAFEMLDTDKNRGNKWISINPKEVDKFKTLKSLCSKLNIKVEEAIFFGDSTNDLSAISNVGLGVAMGNALEIVKKEAKEITLSNDEDGIAVFLEKICNTTKE